MPPKLILALAYELLRFNSTLLRALDGDAGILEPLRGDRWRPARIFFITQTTRRDHDPDCIDSVRPVCLRKSGRDVRYNSAAVRDDRGDKAIRFQWNKRGRLETNA